MMTRFIHAADIHLDSPLASIQQLDPRAAERLRKASRKSFENVIAAAIDHQVAALLIAGDLFDAPVKDIGAAIWVESQLKRLVRADIPVVLIAGNHDALSNAARVIQWSDGIHQLSADQPETIVLEEARLAIHGQSFKSRSVTEDLAATYPPRKQGYFNIGLLHTSLAGDANHDTYAPTTTQVLESKGYDYWALGHIHARSADSLSDSCYIGYSGIIQGRHIRESGAKGCNLVTLKDGRLHDLQFLPTDCVRWHELIVDIAAAERIADLEDLVLEAARNVQVDCDDRDLAVRVRLVGLTNLHSDLMSTNTQRQLQVTLATSLRDLGEVWLESLKIESRPITRTDSDALDIPLKYIHRITQQLRENEVSQNELYAAIDDLMRKAQGELIEYGFPLASAAGQKEHINAVVDEAEALLIAKLSQEVGQ